jgi:hypothetical protein
MSRRVLVLLLVLGLVGCGLYERHVVVQPEEVPKLNDSAWTIKSAPAARPQ